MSGRRVGRPVSNPAETVTPIAANATNSVSYRKILLSGAFAALLVVVAASVLFRVDMSSVAASGILKCYDNAGNYEPCVAPASASLSQFIGRTIEAHQPASWTTTALYQQDSPATTAVDQPENWKTSAPAARRSGTPRKRPASAISGRRLIPRFFSALRRGVTHLASAAAIESGALPAREPKERYRPKDL
jgi:hypothetical protein